MSFPIFFCSLCFFFQAEDGIRDWSVTGVQTCALPIWDGGRCQNTIPVRRAVKRKPVFSLRHGSLAAQRPCKFQIGRASCREKCRSRWSPYHYKNKKEDYITQPEIE